MENRGDDSKFRRSSEGLTSEAYSEIING